MKAKRVAAALLAAACVAVVGAAAGFAGCAEGEIKALKFNGVEATVANVENGSYTLSRPFIVCYQSYDGLNAAAKDFVNYIFSSAAQTEVADEGYIAVEAKEYTTDTTASGTVKISGSTSVGPLMQNLVGMYESVNPNVRITVNQNGSGSGITEATDGTVDIAMSSRDLTTDEEASLEWQKIATDGIAIIVNAKSDLDNVTTAQLKALYEDGTGFEGILAGISRESGSGTRSAFEELVGIEKNYTGVGFDSYNSTNAVISAIKSNSAANKIGYISLGAL
ncbi:MAG: substrate-binding domain-containing protein [Clostridia bacterium]|nr:substrate-binding domain-containing protein [Clostridia bacterium]